MSQQRFVAWYNEGSFDVGIMTADALRRVGRGASWDDAGQDVWEVKPEGSNAGNGSVMRCAPLALAFADDWDILQGGEPRFLADHARRSAVYARLRRAELHYRSDA